MSILTRSDTDLTMLQNDIGALKQDVARLIEHLTVGAANAARSAASNAESGSRRLWRDVSGEGSHALKTISGRIEKQPLAALLIAAGIGYIGSRLLSR